MHKNNEKQEPIMLYYIEMLLHDGYVRNCFEVFGIFQRCFSEDNMIGFFILILGGQTMQDLRYQRDLYHGKGALEALKTFKGVKRAMVCVGGGSMKRFGFWTGQLQYLEEAGMEVKFV